MEQNIALTFFILLALWILFYLVAEALKLQRFGVEVRPLYAIFKSKKLNSFLERTGRRCPRLWRVLGNVGIAASFGQVAFMTYLLFLNLFRFVYTPERASPVMPLIPGVTIRLSSLPWFLAAAGVVILTHELAHGIQCVVEGVSIKSSALIVAVITFGGAVEPDEEEMEAAPMLSKMRIFAVGSLVNLATGLIVIIFFVLLGRFIPPTASLFLEWIYFLSINLALLNMLPIYPLDGGQMFRVYSGSMQRGGKAIQQLAMYCFIALMAFNLILSLVRFGLVPL